MAGDPHVTSSGNGPLATPTDESALITPTGDRSLETPTAESNPTGDRSLERAVIGCIIRVHQVLGPGFVESIYQQALIIELQRHGLLVDWEVRITVLYEGQVVGRHRLDLLVEGQLIVEVKAVTALHRIHYAQLRSYLKATSLPAGILVNFSTPKADFRRVTP